MPSDSEVDGALQQIEIDSSGFVGFESWFAYRSGSDAGDEVGVRHLDPTDAGDPHGPTEGSQRSIVGYVVSVVDSDHDATNR